MCCNDAFSSISFLFLKRRQRSERGIYDLGNNDSLFQFEDENKVFSVHPSLTEVKFSEIIEGIERDDGSIYFSSPISNQEEAEQMDSLANASNLHKDSQGMEDISQISKSFDFERSSYSFRTVEFQTAKYYWYNCTKFFVGFVITLASFSSYAYYLYREEYISNAVLYHLTRSDFRHNFSYHFFSVYLNMEQVETTTKLVLNSSLFLGSLWSFAPQLIILLYSSFLLAPLQNLSVTIL